MRRLLLLLDGDVQQIYDDAGENFRPRFYPFLIELAHGKALCIGDLAAIAQVSQPAATQTIREMATAGWVKVRTGTDRRSREVEISAAGRALVGRIAPTWRAVAEAAAALDRELPVSLYQAVDAACAALERKPFRARIEEQR
ncbi:MAG: winged helix-turn-helix transcriptional regulator [Xanthomonadales bacterium]|nr:winged helix-turn-helix transcriptional regulator [Xanthomonadales bacterium]